MNSQRILTFYTSWIALILLLVSFANMSSARADEIRLSEIPIVNLLEELDYFEAAGRTPEGATTIEFTIVNDTADDVFLHFRTEMLSPLAFEFHFERQEAPVLQSPFRSRTQKSHASQGPILSSGLIAMSTDERVEVRAVFEAPPGPELFPISILPKEHYDSQKQHRLLSHGMFLGAMMTFVVLFLLSPNFLLNAASNWFGVYLASMALLTLHAHGYSLNIPSITPDNYFLVTRILHTCVMLFYLLFILAFLKAKEAYPTFWKAVWAFIIIGTTIAALEQLLASDGFQAIANLVPLSFLIFGFCGAYLAVRDRLHGARFFMSGFGLLAVGGVINFFASLPGLALWNAPIDQVTLLIQTTDALVFGGAILNQMYGLRRARDHAVDIQLSETQRRLELSNELLAKEGDLRRAHDLAERHRATLASTSHDLRQPLASLRTSLEIAKDRSPQLVEELSAGVEFLERLLGQTQANTRSGTHTQDATDSLDQIEAVDLQVILQNAQRMFAPEAAQKGIDLKIVDTSVSVHLPTIDLIRIVSNLISNAVNYTSSGTVVIGVRRRAGGAAIEVWDTGDGIPSDQLEGVLQPYVRGSTSGMSAGEGLGLAIVKELADQNDLTLKVRSTPGRGSVFIVDGLVVA